MDRASPMEHLVDIPIGQVALKGNFGVPDDAQGIVIFAHGSGSGRHSPRNQFVAAELRTAGLGTLLMDLLTAAEEAADQRTGHLRFDIPLLAERLVAATDWLHRTAGMADLPIGYFGASTGGGAALVAAERPERIRAVVSRGGRPDLAGDALPHVRAPTLLIVGSRDLPVVDMNRQALDELGAEDKQLVLVPGATHLFEEPGALEEVAQLAADWFTRHLSRALATPSATGR